MAPHLRRLAAEISMPPFAFRVQNRQNDPPASRFRARAQRSNWRRHKNLPNSGGGLA